MDKYVLRTNKLSKRYKDEYAIQDVSMNIKEGEIYGFIGRNGAGKTTLIRLVTGLGTITNGTIELFGGNGEDCNSKARKRIGALIENPAFYGDMTAYENMELIRLQKGIPGKGCIEEKLELVGLTNVKKKKVKKFSLGMKQKLGLAMALLGEPEFIILDEPTNGLDPMGIIEMRELLKKINKEKNITMLISSHILGELYQLATCYGIINNGKLLEEITQKELDEKCRKNLEIKVDNTEKAVWIIENILETTNFKVIGGDIIRLFEFVEDPGKVSKAFANEGIVVEQIAQKGEDLESYFMNLVGGNK